MKAKKGGPMLSATLEYLEGQGFEEVRADLTDLPIIEAAGHDPTLGS